MQHPSSSLSVVAGDRLYGCRTLTFRSCSASLNGAARIPPGTLPADVPRLRSNDRPRLIVGFAKS